MASYNKHEDFVEQVLLGKHVFNTHVFKVVLTNSAPTAANTILANITQIANGNGYTTGGSDAQLTMAEASGTATVTGTMVVFTASGGTLGPFRYVDLYNDTQTSPADPLVGWWDYGSALTLQVGETFSVKFNGSGTTGTVFTLA